MDSQHFDHLVRQLSAGRDRRRVVRAGIGMLAAVSGGVFGVSSFDPAAANKKHKHKHQRTHGDSKETTICYLAQTLRVPKDRIPRLYPGATVGACTCPADRPITCGLGCCPTSFPLCCPILGLLGPPGNLPATVCATTNARCCPIDQGGAACESPFAQCCPPTNAQTRAFCAPIDAACCTNASGINGATVCPAPYTQCCPATATNLFPGCCRPSERCCGRDSDCPAGLVCARQNGAGAAGGGCCRADLTDERAVLVGDATMAERIGIPAS